MKRHTPPKIPLRFFRWYCHPKLVDHIEGDLLEEYSERTKKFGKRKADIKFIIDVLLLFRPGIIKPAQGYKHLNTFGMYKSYFKIGWRNLLKNKTYSLVNIGGLAIGLACCISIGLYVWDEVSHDSFHSHHSDIYRVVNQQTMGGDRFNIAVTPGPLGSALKSDFPEVQQFCRLGKMRSSGILQYGALAVEPGEVLIVDNTFFSVFDFDLIQGNKQKALLEPDEVVITERMAIKLFGNEWQRSDQVINKQLLFSDGRVLLVAGVAQDPPPNSHIQFDVLLSLRYDELNSRNYSWESNNYHTYILINPNADGEALNHKVHKHLDKYLSNASEITLYLQPLSDVYLYSDFDFQTDWSKTGNIAYVRIFIAVGLIVLGIALSNFVNLSTARAIKRAKEVGVRKVIGAMHRQLISQFLSESLIVTVHSVCLALGLAQVFLPILNDISGKSLLIPFDQPSFILVIIGFTLVISLTAGLYPAFYMSNFQPVKVLKGFISSRGGQLFRRSLVVGQFTLSVILIVGTIVIYQQLTFLQDKNLGFDKSQLLYVVLKNDLPFKALQIKEELQNQTSIFGVSLASNNLVDVVRSTGAVEWEGKGPDEKILLTHMNVDYDFLNTTGMTLVAGRNIDPAIASDTISAYLINEAAAKRMGWKPEEALGKKLSMWGFNGEVIGVVKDFHYRPMTEAIEPFLFRYWPRESCSGLFVKAQGNRVHDAISDIERIYRKHDAKTAPYYMFVDDVLQNQYRVEQNTGRIVLCFSVLAIIVSCLGLFGLATYMAELRIKEIGVRKVLGASVASIAQLLSQDFLKLVAIGILLATPVAWWSMTKWLHDFAYRITIEWWIFVISGVGAIAVALFTVSIRTISAALMNPVKSLRSE